MNSPSSRVAEGLRPFWGRVTVQESPVDETATQSGLLLPMTHDGDDGLVRGVVLHCSDWSPNGASSEAAVLLTPGTVVYYRKTSGLKILGVVVLAHSDVLALEED